MHGAAEAMRLLSMSVPGHFTIMRSASCVGFSVGTPAEPGSSKNRCVIS